MSYKVINSNTQKISMIDLPNCEITTDTQKYIVKDGIITVFNLVDGKIKKGDNGSETQKISLSDKQLAIFDAVKKRDNYTDRLDWDDFENLDDDFKSILMGTYGDKKTTKLRKIKTKSNRIRYKSKNKKTKETESLDVKLEKPKKKSWFRKTWLGRLFFGDSKPKVIRYTSHEMKHKVKAGEDLTFIAKNYDVDYEELVNSNPQLWEMSELQAGQKIKIPKTENSKKQKYYVVKGDTLSSIAKKYNISLNELKQANKNLYVSTREPEVNSRITIPETKHKTKVAEDNVSVIPQKTYIVEKNNMNPSTIANDNDISLYRLALANPDYVKTDADGNIIFDKNGEISFTGLQEGDKIVIPEHKIVTKLPELTIKAISAEVGVSEAYIRDILFGIEGRHSNPDLEVYDDMVAPPNPDGSKMTDNQKKERLAKGWAIGTPTVGFGHTGRVHGEFLSRNSSKWHGVTITEEEAYLILANDIFSAQQDARAYLGEDFDNAPQSLQEAMVDIVFNKGVAGFERKNSPCLNLKEDLAKGDYVSAAADAIVDPTIIGLMKRNSYRVLVATRDLSDKERQDALDKAEDYKNRTISILRKKKYFTDAKKLEDDWAAARENHIAHGFFIS